MAAHLIQETDIIDVSSLSVCIYGPPGTGKSSLANTSAQPLCLDLDRGNHRAFNRKLTMRFDGWRDIEEAWPEIAKRSTVIVDTIGRGLDLLGADIIAGNAKHGTAAGGMSLQGYGVLKARFALWNAQLNNAGKDRVYIAHEKEEKDGDDRIMRPDVQGGSYTELMKTCDLVGYLYRDRNGKRLLDFNPSDRHLGKNAAGWKVMEVPDLAEHPTFLADLIADAKARIGKTAEASAAVAKEVDQWAAWADKIGDNIDAFNAALPDIGSLKGAAKKQAWAVVTRHAEANHWTLDKAAKKFTAPAETVA